MGAEEWVTAATGELYFLFLPHTSIYLSTIYLSSIVNLSYNYHLSNMKLPNYYLSIFNLSSIYHLSIINLSSFCHLSTYTLRVNTKHQTDCIITPKVFLRVQEEQGAFTVRFLMRTYD